VDAVSQASHLVERVKGSNVRVRIPSPPLPAPPNSIPTTAELSGLITYRICPRRYYYDFVRHLKPDTGLHPAARIENAVLKDLFAPHDTVEDNYPDATTNTLNYISNIDAGSLEQLQLYAEQLLSNGREWLGAIRSKLPNPIEIICGGMPLRISPHRLEQNGSVIKLGFVRKHPYGYYKRQQKVLKWVLLQLNEAYPEYSFTGEIFILSTGALELVYPYSRYTYDTYLVNLKSLLSGDFNPKTGSWECPRCRHFMHCPA
ncbi:MAG: hypothetical protein KAV87_20605, partial [Desulfobacteraceae bacterium]|nr:hypothetical protein [Desulfobacteraceae bacterium]